MKHCKLLINLRSEYLSRRSSQHTLSHRRDWEKPCSIVSRNFNPQSRRKYRHGRESPFHRQDWRFRVLSGGRVL